MVAGLPSSGLLGNKVAITVTLAPSWMFPETKNAPSTIEEIAGTAARCREAGAAIAHIHAKPGEWNRLISETRKRTDILIQAGMSSYPIEQRSDAFESHPDMISVMLGQHDEAFVNQDVYAIHTREELLAYADKCRKFGVRPEFEIWHQGSIWTLEYLIRKEVLDKPYWCTLFFGWPGGNWTPVTLDEMWYRTGSVPLDSICSVSAMGRDTWDFMSKAVSIGNNVRVGTEDCPFDIEGSAARDNTVLVRRMAEIVRNLAKSVATPQDVREAIRMKGN
jgi:3-keto-5-aminohexanoate cleavage enzyme